LTGWILKKKQNARQTVPLNAGLYGQTVQRFSTVQLFISAEKNAWQTVSLNDKTSRSDGSAVLDSSDFHLDGEI
jgi:hypothetical protein